jgi:hypothetical protein
MHYISYIEPIQKKLIFSNNVKYFKVSIFNQQKTALAYAHNFSIASSKAISTA